MAQVMEPRVDEHIAMKNFSIVVAYNPDVATLSGLCAAIASQGFRVVVVDNSEQEVRYGDIFGEKCHLIALGENKGIAHAQNVGIRYAIGQGAELVALFDQDSVISVDLLSKLSEPLAGNKLAVTAPVSVDKASGAEYPAHALGIFGLPRDVYSRSSKGLSPVDIVIASGSVIPVPVFQRVGLFDEDFFIDFVDIEWCLRCRREGIPIFIIPEAVMQHSIGDAMVGFWVIKTILHSPYRTYYKVRNSILLARKNVRFLFALHQILASLVHNFLPVIFTRNHLTYLKSFMLGIFHGLIGRVGKY